VHSVLAVFEEGLKSLNGISQVERSLVKEDFFKSEPPQIVKCPTKSADCPTMPTEEERKKGALPDENMWLWTI